jgi:hypothetical protein
MMKLLKQTFQTHGRLMLLTFELFWIVIFVLDRISSGGGSGVPDFVYVNF